MNKYAKLITLLLLASAQAWAEEPSPIGQWRVENGKAHVRILRCGEALWGVLSWLEAPGTDENNPDPAQRNRPMLGLPILRGMTPNAAGSEWAGKIYNADNGKIYTGSIALNASDELRIKGCILDGWVCGGENWVRLPATPAPKDDRALCRSIAAH